MPSESRESDFRRCGDQLRLASLLEAIGYYSTDQKPKLYCRIHELDCYPLTSTEAATLAQELTDAIHPVLRKWSKELVSKAIIQASKSNA